MEYLVTKQTSNLNNKEFLKAQLVNVKTMDLRKLAQILAKEGSTASEADIYAVLTLLANRLPQLMAMGYKFPIDGLGTFCPTVSGSLTEEGWRAARIKTLMEEDSTLTEATAKTKQAEEVFKTSLLTSAKLTASYKLKKDSEFEDALQNAIEWECKNDGTVDEDSTEAKSSSSSSSSNSGWDGTRIEEEV